MDDPKASNLPVDAADSWFCTVVLHSSSEILGYLAGAPSRLCSEADRQCLDSIRKPIAAWQESPWVLAVVCAVFRPRVRLVSPAYVDSISAHPQPDRPV